MNGRVMFSVICVVLSACQLIFAQPPFFFHRRQGSWGYPNEIHGNVGPIRPPPPGVLVAGHIPPGARLLGPGHPGARLFLSSSPPPQPAWPSHGPQIQKAKTSSHFEYEVFPHPMNRVKPPTILRPGPQGPPPPPHPSSSEMTQEIMRLLAAEGSLARTSPVPFLPGRPQSRTDRPPMRPPMIMAPRPTPAGPTESDFQEGYRILSDLFLEDSNGDIRNNLVGGSEVSFNGGAYHPFTNADAVIAHQPQQNVQSPPQQKVQVQQVQSSPPPSTTPAQKEQSQKENETIAAGSETDMHIVPAEETVLPDDIAESEIEPSAQPSNQMQKSESSYAPPQFGNGPPPHSSFMFTDPNEGPGGFTVHDHGYSGTPPPFHPGGNSIIPGPSPAPQQRGQNNGAKVNSQQGQQQQHQQQKPQQQQASQNNGYKTVANSLRSGANSNLLGPIMMMPISRNNVNGNQPQPSSEEVQYALGILARYASKQAQQPQQQQQQASSIQSPSYGLPQLNQASPNPSYGAPQQNQQSPSAFGGAQDQNSPSQSYGAPQQTSPSSVYGVPQQSSLSSSYGAPQQASPNSGYAASQQSSPSSDYGVPQQTSPSSVYGTPEQQKSSPNSAYGAPQQNQQSTTVSSYLPSSSYEIPPQGNQIQGPSGQYATTEESAITISASNQLDESSPYPVYGPPSSSYGVGPTGLIGAKVEALKSIQSAVKGGFRSITGLKAGILNAGLNAIGSLGNAKGQLANSLKIPLLPQKEGYVAYGAPSAPQPTYGPPEDSPLGWGAPQTSTASIINGVKDLVGQVTGTIAQTGKAAVGIGLSKNQFLKNNFAIKGQMFTDTVSKKIHNKNQYFQNVLKHVQSIFDAATARPNTGGKNPW